MHILKSIFSKKPTKKIFSAMAGKFKFNFTATALNIFLAVATLENIFSIITSDLLLEPL